jgi:Domain of unknown function (DUF4377)
MTCRFTLGAAFVVSMMLSVACDATEPREQAVHLQVGADSIACVGAHGPQLCLQVRELVGGDAWGAWQPFFDAIEGFVYERGFIYDLAVARREIRNPPADGSSYAYRLLTILSKVAPPAQ